MGFRSNLKLIWNETSVPSGTVYDIHPGFSRRFIAKSFNDGGYGWGVWDQREQRFLKNAEVKAMTPDKCRELFVN